MPRQGHNTPLPLRRSPPASFKRLLGRCDPVLLSAEEIEDRSPKRQEDWQPEYNVRQTPLPVDEWNEEGDRYDSEGKAAHKEQPRGHDPCSAIGPKPANHYEGGGDGSECPKHDDGREEAP